MIVQREPSTQLRFITIKIQSFFGEKLHTMKFIIRIFLSIVATYYCGAIDAEELPTEGWGNFSQPLDHFVNKTSPIFAQVHYAQEQ